MVILVTIKNTSIDINIIQVYAPTTKGNEEIIDHSRGMSTITWNQW